MIELQSGVLTTAVKNEKQDKCGCAEDWKYAFEQSPHGVIPPGVFDVEKAVRREASCGLSTPACCRVVS